MTARGNGSRMPTIAILAPVLILFFFAQRFFLRGIDLSGVQK